MVGGFVLARGNTKLMFSTSLISVLSTAAVIISLVCQPNFRRKQSSIILLNLFVSQFLTSLGSMVGEPEDKSVACWFEAIVTNIFTLSSVFWAVIVAWLLFATVRVFRKPVNLKLVAVLCYGIPTIVTFATFANASYGSPPPEAIGWCWVIETSRTPAWAIEFWYWVNFYGWMWLSFLALFVLLLSVLVSYLHLRSIKSPSLTALRELLISLAGYPIAIVIAWFPSTCEDFYDYNHPEGANIPDWVHAFINICACSMGTFCAFAYFVNPSNRRQLLAASRRVASFQTLTFSMTRSQTDDKPPPRVHWGYGTPSTPPPPTADRADVVI
eukprot:c45810_g1_i1.p1 GENE.c45810_g1_i1~~c45810_g1_i1.p1  ORF type:complete len:343 (-),score=53.89 c45810_g1_i1:87-1067(-)